MEPVTEPLPLQYDLKLILLALSFAAVASIVCFIGLSRLAGRRRQTGWLAFITLCVGAGIWTAHLLAALSLEADARGFNPAIGALAFAAALTGAGAGIAIALKPGRAMAFCAGAVIGAGIAATHFIGMSAFSFAATPAWDPLLRPLAAALAIVLAGGAMLAFREFKDKAALLSGATLLTAAIAACLFTAMAGFALMDELPDTPAYPPLDARLLIIAATTFTGAVLLAALLLAFIERRVVHGALSRVGELMDAAVEGLVLGQDGRIVSINERMLELTGSKSGELIGKRIFGDLLGGRQRTASASAPLTFEARLIGRVDKLIPVQATRRPLQAFAGANEVFAISDLRERIDAARRIEQLTGDLAIAQADLYRRNVLLEHVLGSLDHGLCMFDAEQRVVIANDRYAALYGLPPEAAQPGTRSRDIIQKRIDKGLFAGPSPKAYMEDRLAPVEKAGDTLHELSDGRLIAIHQRPIPGGGWIATHDDVTERRRREEESLRLADLDALTQLPNRTSLRRLLNEMLEPALEKSRRLAVLILNLDHFRDVNGALGHRTGDALLKAVAERLRSHTRQATLLARFGDDEFVIVEAVDQPGRDASALAGRLQEKLRQPLKIEGHSISVDSTIGIAIAPADGKDADQLLQRAELALSHTKKEARGSHQFFALALEKRLTEQLQLEHELAQALKRNEFELYYQPLISLARNEICGFEAILRWSHPVRGAIAPEIFVPAAEAAGLTTAIGEWVLMQACAEAMHWPSQLKLALPVAAAQFRSRDFVRLVTDALQASELPAQRLELEISEKLLEEEPDHALTMLHQLSEAGLGITLTDFGWALTSLSHLRRFPFQRVKISPDFVGSLSEKPDSLGLLRILAQLSAGLGAQSCADGVETQQQVDIIRAEGCSQMQGRFFSPPRSAAEIRRLFLPKAEGAVA